MSNKEGFSIGFEMIGIALLFIAFWGEPDLVDALIKYFMGSC
jgi:hypothetical protein